MDRQTGTNEIEKATFAGGCFWCMTPPFENLEGVKEVVAGYAGGEKEEPDYEEVSSGKTGHVEAVKITFYPAKIRYEELLDVFWKQIDPTDDKGQFADRGSQYKTVIFYYNNKQKELAEKSKKDMDESGRYDKPVKTEIKPFTNFYRAEQHHQDYHKKKPVRYKLYRSGSGRDNFLDEHWEKSEDEKLRRRLTPLQYRVTQNDETEPAFNNEYWDNKEEGLYVDVVSGELLFTSQDKFESYCGWPSFTKPIDKEKLEFKEDRESFMPRTEVKNKNSGSHLGHVFDDGPEPTGKRYCINSSAMKFIPKDKLEEEGYGEYKELLKK